MPRAWLMVCLALLGVSVATTPAYPQDLASETIALYDQAWKLAAEGKHKEAIPLLEKAATMAKRAFGPTHVNVGLALRELANSHEKLKNRAEAVQYYLEAIHVGEANRQTGEMPNLHNRVGFQYRLQAKHSEAEKHYRRAIEICMAIQGSNSLDGAIIQTNLGALYQEMGRLDEAEKALTWSIRVLISHSAQDRDAFLNGLRSLAKAQQQLGKHAQAEQAFDQCVRFLERKHGPDHLDVAWELVRLGNHLHEVDYFAKAEVAFRRALTIFEKHQGPDHPDVALVLNNLGNAARHLGAYDQAEAYYRRGYAILEAKPGKYDLNLDDLLYNWGILHDLRARFDEAEKALLRSIAILEADPNPDLGKLGERLDVLAGIYNDLGQSAKAEQLYQRSTSLIEERHGPKHPKVAVSLSNYATYAYDVGDYPKSEALALRALSINEAYYGKDGLPVSGCLNNLAVTYGAMGQPEKAITMLERSLAIKEARGLKDHPDLAANLNNLGLQQHAKKDYAKAEATFKRSLAIYERHYGKDHPQVALSLNNLAGVARDAREYAKAESLFQRSLTIYEKKFGPDHPKVAHLHYSIGTLYDHQRDYAKAEPSLALSLKKREAALGRDDPNLAPVLECLASGAVAMGQWEKALGYQERVRRQARRYVSRILPALSEREQLAFLKELDEPTLHGWLSFGLLRKDDTTVTAASAGWLLNGKGLAQQTLAERGLAARDHRDPELADVSKRLAGVRQELARLTVQEPRPGQEQTRASQLEKLTQQEVELSKRIAAGRGAVAQEDPWVELTQVRRHVPADAVLVEFARFAHYDYHAKNYDDRWLPARYAAWIIPPAGKGEVQIVDLGLAETIDDEVRRVRLWMDPRRELPVRVPLKKLSTLLLQPLEAHLGSGSARQLLVSPDADLWLVPWAALLTADDKHLVEKYAVTTLISGRDLVAKPRQDLALAAPLVLADPDFDAQSPAAGANSAAPANRTRSASLDNVARLPQTAVEARAITPALRRMTGQEPQVHVERDANEATFKVAQRPRFLVLSTHGFFFEESRNQVENPLLRCGLLLAGCNQRRELASGQEDGVLTGLEIVGADLRGTELVVLSACDTGLGDVRNGEGVAGLRQAFQLAGASAVVASLWKVPDAETAELMTAFFGQLAQGKSQADALRAAQLDLIAKLREEKKGTADPYKWAAFTLTGSAR